MTQDGSTKPNVSDAFLNPPRNQPVDWSLYRPIVLFGQFPKTLRTQYSAQYNLTIKRELPGDILLQVGYVGTQGHRLLAIHDQNAAAARPCLDLQAISDYYTNVVPNQALANAYSCGPFFEDSSFSLPANSVPAGFQLHLPYGSVPTVGPGNPAITLVGLRPYSSPNCQPTTGIGCPTDGTPIFGSIFNEGSDAYSNYNSLQALFEKRFSHGLQFQASYTYSKSLDNASSFEEILNPLNFNSTYGPSLFDSRHRFVFNYVWELPIPKKEGMAGKFANGWEVSGIYTYQSGFPILIGNCNDQELQGSTLGFECPGKPDLSGPVRIQNPRINGNVFADPTVFSNSALGLVGNSPRTLCCNSPINNWDFGVFKTTAINERVRVSFRTEIFNIFNHAQFYGVDGGTSNTTFGQPQKVRDPRLVQFALKILF